MAVGFHEVELAPCAEGVDEPVGERAQQQLHMVAHRLRLEGRGHERAVDPVLLALHAQ